MGFFRRLFGRERPLHDHKHNYPATVTTTKPTPLRKYKLEGQVRKVWDGPDEILASGGCVKEAVSGQALKEAWERDMKIAFPMGADYNVEYHCTVTDVTEGEKPAVADDRDDGDGVDATALAAVAAVGAATLFR